MTPFFTMHMWSGGNLSVGVFSLFIGYLCTISFGSPRFLRFRTFSFPLYIFSDISVHSFAFCPFVLHNCLPKKPFIHYLIGLDVGEGHLTDTLEFFLNATKGGSLTFSSSSHEMRHSSKGNSNLLKESVSVSALESFWTIKSTLQMSKASCLLAVSLQKSDLVQGTERETKSSLYTKDLSCPSDFTMTMSFLSFNSINHWMAFLSKVLHVAPIPSIKNTRKEIKEGRWREEGKGGGFWRRR